MEFLKLHIFITLLDNLEIVVLFIDSNLPFPCPLLLALLSLGCVSPSVTCHHLVAAFSGIFVNL